MTTIATDGVTIAADGRQCMASEVINDNARKIIVRSGHIFACAGSVPMTRAAIDWFLGGAVPSEVPKAEGQDWALVVIGQDRRMIRFTDKCAYPDEFPYPQGFGSGSEYAQAAVLCGKTPKEAIQLIIDHKLDTGTGGTVMEVNIDEALRTGAPQELMAAE